VVAPDSLPPQLLPLAWTCAGHHAVALKGDAAAPAKASAMASGARPGESAHGATSGDGDGGDGAAGGAVGGEGGPILMALAHSSFPHYGVQFHPESVATRFGVQLLANFRDLVAEFYGRPRPPAVHDGVGPPGRCLAPRPWPQAEEADAAAVAGAGRRYGGCWGDGGADGGGGREQATAAPAAELATVGPGTASTRLRLQWARLRGVVEAVGGSQALFEALAGPGGGADAFWLDRCADCRVESVEGVDDRCE
jgi:para-aminobenzoate synthetase